MENKNSVKTSQEAAERLANGVEPKEIFDFVDYFVDGFARVEINGKGCNYLKEDGTLLWQGDEWFDNCYDFYNGFAIVKIKNKGFNVLKPDGTLLWQCDIWFDEFCRNFENGYSRVHIKGKGWNY